MDGSESIMSSVRLHKVRLFVEDFRTFTLLFFTEKTGSSPCWAVILKINEEVQRSQLHLLCL